MDLFDSAEEETRTELLEVDLIGAFQPVILHWIMLSKASAAKWVDKVRCNDRTRDRKWSKMQCRGDTKGR